MKERLIGIKEEIQAVKGELISNYHDTKKYNIKLKAILTLLDYVRLVIDLVEE